VVHRFHLDLAHSEAVVMRHIVDMSKTSIYLVLRHSRDMSKTSIYPEASRLRLTYAARLT
jgi:hypothetical protein